ncbi:MAG TPA: PIN domain nuclease [Bellilinea sp.]|nr:PIN domain nuclease [Bellilinea sp.]
MSIDLIFRLIGMVVLAITGVFGGVEVSKLDMAGIGPNFLPGYGYMISLGLIGAVVGFLITPYLTTKPVTAMIRFAGKISAATLVWVVIGLISGLIIGALLAFPLSKLPGVFGSLMPIVGVALFGYLGVAIVMLRQNDLSQVIRILPKAQSTQSLTKGKDAGHEEHPVLLDTSVIIDGRIADIAKTGFVPGKMVIPRFVLNELQFVADSADDLRRQRGRRGMDVISQMQKDPSIYLSIEDLEMEGVRDVDEKLIMLARSSKYQILTNDYNLNRIAELQGVRVLNVNELANAVKSVVLPGEPLLVSVIQEGKEHGQGVGYMEDGTMIVVEDGKDLIGRDVTTTVTKVLQTAAGRMIFARVNPNQGG